MGQCSCSQDGAAERAQELIESNDGPTAIRAPPLPEVDVLPVMPQAMPSLSGKADDDPGSVEEVCEPPRPATINSTPAPAASKSKADPPPRAKPGAKVDPVTLQVVPARNLGDGDQDDMPVLIRVQPPDSTERVPACFCCVLDVSTSMGMEAKIVGSNGSTESHGLSLLDVAKHGVRTVINVLSEEDQLAIVTFNHQASLLLGITVMDDAGKKAAEAKLDTVISNGGTDIWQGLQTGLDTLRPLSNNRICHIILLSDGESSYRDEIMPNLEKHKERHGQFPGSISTFGFGYNIDSDLLGDLATAGDGSYGFIPDPGFIGTAFVNTVSNLLATCARGVRLVLEPTDDSMILEVLGGHEVAVDEATDALIVKLGMVQYQQTKDIIVRMSVKGTGQYLRVSGQYEPLNLTGIPVVPFDVAQGSPQGSREVAPQIVRCKLVGALNSALELGAFKKTNSMESFHSTDNFKRAHSITSMGSSPSLGGRFKRADSTSSAASSPAAKQTTSLVNRVSRSLSGLAKPAPEKAPEPTPPPTPRRRGRSHFDREEALRVAKDAVENFSKEVSAEFSDEEPLIKAICEDIAGQVGEAVSCKDYFVKWGRHYLPSIMFAHKLQQCNNFKDPGVQLYGGALFEDLRDMADDIFNELPPPRPSARRTDPSSHVHAPVSMAVYNDRYAG